MPRTCRETTQVVSNNRSKKCSTSLYEGFIRFESQTYGPPTKKSNHILRYDGLLAVGKRSLHEHRDMNEHTLASTLFAFTSGQLSALIM